MTLDVCVLDSLICGRRRVGHVTFVIKMKSLRRTQQRQLWEQNKMIIWYLKMLTFIDGKPLKAGLLLRGSTVFSLSDI